MENSAVHVYMYVHGCICVHMCMCVRVGMYVHGGTWKDIHKTSCRQMLSLRPLHLLGQNPIKLRELGQVGLCLLHVIVVGICVCKSGVIYCARLKKGNKHLKVFARINNDDLR